VEVRRGLVKVPEARGLELEEVSWVSSSVKFVPLWQAAQRALPKKRSAPRFSAASRVPWSKSDFPEVIEFTKAPRASWT
jgi:hypothetical protein